MSEEIEIIPEQVLVKRHIYPRYACRVCEGSGDEDKPVFRSAIRPFDVERKNWLFSGSPRGADGSCFFYSLIETAKANNLNPYDYLRWIFKTAPRLSKAQYENLLPWKVDREAVKRAAGRGWRN